MKRVTLISFLLLVISCQKESQKLKQNPYLGDWSYDTIVKYDSTRTHMGLRFFLVSYGHMPNFSILNDSVLDFKPGFLYHINNKIEANNNDDRYTGSAYYLGTKTNCRIKESTIFFFNKTEARWDTIRVKKIVGDTMIVCDKKEVEYRFLRKHNDYSDDTKYDAISLQRSPCFGHCPFNSTYIDRKGNFYFKAYDSNTQYGNFHSKLDNEKVKDIFNKFDKINILKLKDSYFASATCGQTNTISFFKNGKIIKTIECYLDGPEDLISAYTYLSYMYQQLDSYDSRDDKFVFEDYVALSRVEFGKENYRLKESESFFLEVAIRNGKRTKVQFEEKYNLRFFEIKGVSDISKILSDGRYYKFTNRDNTSFTIDIGYNFMDENPIIKQKRQD
jgi:hypothetical protein